MVIDCRLAATFTHRHHIMQTERYIFFVAVVFTLKITLTDRAHVSHQTLIRVLRPLPMRAPSPHNPKLTSFISSRELDPSSWKVFREAGKTEHSELWCESGPVSFGVLPECTAAPAGCFSTSPSHLAYFFWSNCHSNVEYFGSGVFYCVDGRWMVFLRGDLKSNYELLNLWYYCYLIN